MKLQVRAPDMSLAPSAVLDDIIITPLLAQRTIPPRDIVAEHSALTDLVAEAAGDSPHLLQRLVDLAVELCDAGSAGVSLLEPASSAAPEGVFRWVAMSGLYREYVGGTTPEAFSPCGTCLRLGTPQLYREPARLYTYLAAATPPIVEGLVIPLRSRGECLGTIWIVSHDQTRRFTAGDVAIMTSLADFTSAALVMQRARDAAESANRAKDEFLAIVSHELRRPLTAIVGWSAHLLAGRSSPAVAARAIEALHTNARRQQDMIDDLLDASRSGSGTLRLRESDADLAAIVWAAIDLSVDSAAEKGVELAPDVADSLPFRGDPDRLLQVVGNVINNAVKFTPPGGRVAITTEVTPTSVDVSIRDTGIGIAPHLVAVVFDAFRKIDGSSTQRSTGLGLGLTIAKKLAELHGGTLTAQSDGGGRGALFRVSLPACRLLATKRQASDWAIQHVTHAELSGVTILVVEDEPDVRDMLVCVLEDAGARVFAVEGAGDALLLLDRQPIDILLTDLVMPGQDGYDLLANLDRVHRHTSLAAVIAVTALASARERQRAVAAGFDHHVAKPFDSRALVQIIADAAKQKAAR